MSDQQLLNGCSCSKISVHPKNWDKPGVSVKKPWYIFYTFIDPAYQQDPKLKYGKLFIVKRMNKFKTLEQRRAITGIIINEIRKIIYEEGYNPIAKTFMAPVITTEDLTETAFPAACLDACDKLKCSALTKRDVKSALGFIEKSAIALNLHTLPVSQVRRKHISLILDNCKNIKDYWSPHLFNHYRAYLMMVFKKLVELEAIDSNPVDEHLPREITEENLRQLPTDEECKKIIEHVSDDRYYARFLQIFFHSGSRPVEMLRLTTADVDLTEGIFKVKVRKGNRSKEQERPIKWVAMPYWEELMKEVEPGQYLFGDTSKQCKTRLAPSFKKATRDYVTKYWQRRVKDPETGLGIEKDLYALKHKNLDETAAYLSLKEAQKAAGHESKVITMRYAVNEQKRENDRLRDVPNVLGG